MKSTKLCLLSIVLLAMVFAFSVRAHAALELLGQGTSTQGTYNLIYDDYLDITWYDYSQSIAQWGVQVNWALALSVNVGGNVYSDWRLPVFPAEPCEGADCTDSEMGYLYYTGLGNEVDKGLTNTGDFQNLGANDYWSGTRHKDIGSDAWRFSFSNGRPLHRNTDNSLYGLAVHQGRLVVPEPASLLLLGSGLVGLIGLNRKWRKA